jgi:hypothetical protein
MAAMATKKGKNKGKRSAKPAAAKKTGVTARPKKAAVTRTLKGSTARKPAPRKAPSRKPAPRKAAAAKAPPRKAVAAKAPPRKAVAAKAPPRKAATPKAPARKPAARKPAASKAGQARSFDTAASAMKSINRLDRPGHLDPRYVAKLREQSGPEEYAPRAFIEGSRSPNDDLAEELGEEVVERATSGEDEGEESLDQVVPEEQGGPFVETNAAQEFAHGTDASNPKGAKREPFPRT